MCLSVLYGVVSPVAARKLKQVAGGWWRAKRERFIEQKPLDGEPFLASLGMTL